MITKIEFKEIEDEKRTVILYQPREEKKEKPKKEK